MKFSLIDYAEPPRPLSDVKLKGLFALFLPSEQRNF